MVSLGVQGTTVELPYEKTTVEVTVRMIPLELLLSLENPIMTNAELVDSYSRDIQHILKENPLRVWVDPDEPTIVKRVIDGLHRLDSADVANRLYNAGITHLPCKLEVLTEREFLKRRREQTTNHEEISDFRCVKWLKEAYEDLGFEIPLLSVLNFYYSTAEKKGKNFLTKCDITEARLAEIKKFVDDWVMDFGVPGRRAQQTYKALELIGVDDFDIVGLPGVNVDIIKTAYGSLKSIEDSEVLKRNEVSDYRRIVANHILRICSGTDRMRGKVQNLARVFCEGTDEFKELVMTASDYFGPSGVNGATIYERFKSEFGTPSQKEIRKSRIGQINTDAKKNFRQNQNKLNQPD